MDNNTKEFHAKPSTKNGKQPIATRDYFKCTSSIQEAGSFYGSHSTGQNTGHRAYRQIPQVSSSPNSYRTRCS